MSHHAHLTVYHKPHPLTTSLYLPLIEGLLVVDSFWERGRRFSLRLVTPGRLTMFQWMLPYPQIYGQHNWTFKKK